MMKIASRILAMLLALILVFSVAAFAEEEEDPILFYFDGEGVRKSFVTRLLSGYVQSGYISSIYAYDEAIEYLIVNQLTAEAKAAELGLDQFTDEETAEIYAEADEYFEAQKDAVIDAYAPEMTDEEREAFKEELTVYWASMGTTQEVAEDAHLFNKIKSRLLETMDVEITDEEIQNVFEEQVEKDKAYFENNVLAYEYYSYYLSQDIWYTPEGFRRVHQIMLNVDEELTDAYKEVADAGDEAAMEEAQAAILASRQDEVDAIYARLDAGESFMDVMMDVSEDPGLGDTLIEAGGYLVHAESNVYGDLFPKAAFSEKMQKVGDVSDPVAGKYGIQILYYNADEPAGAVELTDRIRESITSYLTSQKRAEMLKAWSEEYEVVYEQELIDQAIEEAKAASEAATEQ